MRKKIIKRLTILITFIILIIHCTSTRDKCLEEYYSTQERCEIFSLLSPIVKPEGRETSNTLVLVNCLQADLKRKQCNKSPNYDANDIF